MSLGELQRVQSEVRLNEDRLRRDVDNMAPERAPWLVADIHMMLKALIRDRIEELEKPRG